MTQVLHGERLRHRISNKGNWPFLGDSVVGTKYAREEYGIELEEINPRHGLSEMG